MAAKLDFHRVSMMCFHMYAGSDSGAESSESSGSGSPQHSSEMELCSEGEIVEGEGGCGEGEIVEGEEVW